MGLFALAAIGLTIFVYFQLVLPNFPTFPCVFLSVLGIYCPGCGGTRAVEALIHGKLLLSVWYHPLVPYSVIIFVGFMVTQTLERLHIGKIKGWKFHNWYVYIALVIVAGNWILKNILMLGFGILL